MADNELVRRRSAAATTTTTRRQRQVRRKPTATFWRRTAPRRATSLQSRWSRRDPSKEPCRYPLHHLRWYRLQLACVQQARASKGQAALSPVPEAGTHCS